MGVLSYGQSKHVNTKKGFAALGYDVVAYFAGESVKGSKEHTAEYEGVNYKFSSSENLETFEGDPAKYVPQYGGYCAYAVAKSGKKVNVDPATFEIREGKLYLFYNSGNTNTLKLWKKEKPEKLRSKADKNWAKIVGE